jgi:hypothetical protein
VPVPWVHMRAKVEWDEAASTTWLTLGVRIDDHHLTNKYFPPALGDRVPMFLRSGNQFGVRAPYSDVLARQDPSPASTVDTILRNMVRELSHLLREYDPRTGSILDEGGPQIPRSPLFDPPRMRPPQWERGASLDSVPCPFCHQKFGRGMPAMWSGGTLLWTHPSCWAGVHS